MDVFTICFSTQWEFHRTEPQPLPSLAHSLRHRSGWMNDQMHERLAQNPNLPQHVACWIQSLPSQRTLPSDRLTLGSILCVLAILAIFTQGSRQFYCALDPENHVAGLAFETVLINMRDAFSYIYWRGWLATSRVSFDFLAGSFPVVLNLLSSP